MQASQKAKGQRKEIFKRAEQYVKEYRQQVSSRLRRTSAGAWSRGEADALAAVERKPKAHLADLAWKYNYMRKFQQSELSGTERAGIRRQKIAICCSQPDCEWFSHAEQRQLWCGIPIFPSRQLLLNKPLADKHLSRWTQAACRSPVAPWPRPSLSQRSLFRSMRETQSSSPLSPPLPIAGGRSGAPAPRRQGQGRFLR